MGRKLLLNVKKNKIRHSTLITALIIPIKQVLYALKLSTVIILVARETYDSLDCRL